MGRWAQAKRRGGKAPVSVPLGPPPAPLLSAVGQEITQTATGSDDTGGTIALFARDPPTEAWSQIGSHDWASPHVWGVFDYVEGREYTSREVGNGLAYSGVSPYSNVVELEA